MSAALSRAARPSGPVPPLLPVPRMLPGHPPPTQRALAEAAVSAAAARLRTEERCLAHAPSWGPARVSECERRVSAAREALAEAEWTLRRIAPPKVRKATGRPMRGWAS